jgi:hypothetical protein
MSSSEAVNDHYQEKILDEREKDEPRSLPSLPRTASTMVITGKDSTLIPDKAGNESYADAIDSLSQELQYSYPGRTPTLLKSKPARLQTKQLSRILKQFEKNVSFFHEREKHVQVEVIVGLEKKLAKFSETLRGAFLNNGLPRPTENYVKGRKMIEWPVCGKYPNCVICSIEIQEIVSLEVDGR